jgi:hypothetical protein
MLHEKLQEIRRDLARERTVTVTLPNKFAFKDHDIHDFDNLLSFFRWDIHECPVKIDLTHCTTANYQALSLLVLYAWQLREQGCRVTFIESNESLGASSMWRKMGARGLFSVLPHTGQRFKGDPLKPLFAVRTSDDFRQVIATAESYTKGFNVEYMETLRYVLGELLYNTMEHGKVYGPNNLRNARIPSIVQFTWYAKRNEIQFVIADIGIGVKRHIEQAYPGQASDEDAIKMALRPKVSGTFGMNDPYKNKDNAGMGLYISSNIVRRLNADMHVVSGNGLCHISPRDVTGKTMQNQWPGTFVLVTLRIDNNPEFVLHKIMQDFRRAANEEQQNADSSEADQKFYFGVNNFFGSHAEEKEAAIKFRDNRLFPAIVEGKNILVDFTNVKSAPHSFLSALFASPIKSLGLAAFKRIKIVNATAEIRETIDFIFDDNT